MPLAPVRWILPAPPPPAAVAALAAELALPEPLCAILIARGLGDAESARRFLRPRLEQLHSPWAMAGMAEAAARLALAVARGETILVHGDYDVDGITATALMTRVLRALGGRVVPFVPHRLADGYDLGDAGVRAALAHGARVVLTCDCGTQAHAAVDALAAAGVDVIVSDHHLPRGALPAAFAVLNPRRPDCGYPDKDLVAAGVAFKLALAILERTGGNIHVAYHLLDLVALATVADVAPLVGENRVLVRLGLKRMAESRVPGVRALVRAAGLDAKPLTAGRVGYILAPRLNAAGRVGHAGRGVELLLTEDPGEANAIARELNELNQRRQDEDRRTLDEARRLLDGMLLADTWGLVLAREGWHAGVIGVVASRVVEETGRPTVLVALHDGVGKGSGRSIPGFDLHGALAECAPLFQRFGGHRAAAGVTLAAADVPAFAARFAAVCAARRAADPGVFEPTLRTDLALPLDRVSDDLEQALRHLEPFGLGNPAPTFVATAVHADGTPRRVGADGVRLRLTDGGHPVDALGWGLYPRVAALDLAQPLDVAFRVERDTYQGASRLQARLVDLRPAG